MYLDLTDINGNPLSSVYLLYSNYMLNVYADGKLIDGMDFLANGKYVKFSNLRRYFKSYMDNLQNAIRNCKKEKNYESYYYLRATSIDKEFIKCLKVTKERSTVLNMECNGVCDTFFLNDSYFSIRWVEFMDESVKVLYSKEWKYTIEVINEKAAVLRGRYLFVRDSYVFKY